MFLASYMESSIADKNVSIFPLYFAIPIENPESRTLLCVTIENAMMAEKRVTELMGDKAELRRNWIEDNVVFTLEDDYREVSA